MESKDWIFLAILACTVVSSHLLVSRQIGRNKKNQWLEDFRRGITNYMALITHTTYNSKREEAFELTKSGMALLFLLDEKDRQQKQLHDAISYLTLFTVQENNQNYLKELESRLHEVKILAKGIIKKEQDRF